MIIGNGKSLFKRSTKKKKPERKTTCGLIRNLGNEDYCGKTLVENATSFSCILSVSQFRIDFDVIRVAQYGRDTSVTT